MSLGECILGWLLRGELRKAKMKGTLNYILERLNEPSTWRGLILVVTALGIKLAPDQALGIITAGLAIVGLINTFRNEKKAIEKAADAAVERANTATIVKLNSPKDQP